MNRDRVITFSVSDDTISYHSYGECLLGLTKDGTVLSYNKYGEEKKTNLSMI